MNVFVAGKTVTCQRQRFKDWYRTHYEVLYKIFCLLTKDVGIHVVKKRGFYSGILEFYKGRPGVLPVPYKILMSFSYVCPPTNYANFQHKFVYSVNFSVFGIFSKWRLTQDDIAMDTPELSLNQQMWPTITVV